MSKPTTFESSMEDLWRDARARFKERTAININLQSPKTLDDCIRKVEESQLPKSPSENSHKEKAKEVGINIIQCLKLLGGVAAQGAEVVFGSPSSLCFNAVFLLLDIPEKLRSFREAVDELFTTIAPYLGMFRIYDKIEQFNEIELELKQAIHAVMISFVDICALYIQLRESGKWQKFKSKMKMLILDDEFGIKNEIEKFERLTTAQHSIQSTQTLKVLLETRSSLTKFLEDESEKSQQIATDVAGLKTSDDKRNLEESRRKNIENIKKRLGIEESVYSSFKEMCEKPGKVCIADTAVWFTGLSQFENWADRDNHESGRLLRVIGASNTGKTVILSNMVHHLRSIYESPTRNSTKTLVSAYFFPNVTVGDDRDKQPISTALKCIAIQLADLDVIYAKNISQICDSKSQDSMFFRNANCRVLWDTLQIGSPRQNVTHYIIFDGLAGLPDESQDTRMEKEQLHRILCESVQDSVRVLLSERQDTFQAKYLPSHSNIEVEQHNELDIRKYIGYFLKDRDLLQDLNDETLRMRISDSLTKQVKGNYKKLKAALENIDAVVASDGDEEEIDKVLAKSGMTEKQITQTTISQLEEKLTGDEIDELNELLLWIICGMKLFDTDELDAVLFLRTKRRGTLRLRKKLEGKYSSILRITSGSYVDVQENIRDLLKKPRTKPRSLEDTPKFSATISITKGDFRSVQTFLWSLSQKIDSLAHQEFGFEQISEHQRMKSDIQVNEVDGNFTIIRRTFQLLAGEPNKESKALGNYLLKYLPAHLNEITNKALGFEELTPAQKQEIGEGLFTLFVSGEVIERHWSSCQSLDWYGNPSKVSIFRHWLDDPSVTGNLGRLDREWLKSVKAHSNPNQALLTKIMEVVARNWLCDRRWLSTKAFQWLKGFRQMSSSGHDEPAASDNLDSKSKDSDVFADVLEWSKGVLSITTNEEKAFMNERIGQTYFGQGQFSKAIQSYNDAINLASPSWMTLEGLAEAFAGDGQYEKAFQTMEKALKVLADETRPNKNIFISAIHSCMAKWQIKLKQPRRAIENMKQAIEATPENDKVYSQLLEIYLVNSFLDDAVIFIRDLVNSKRLKGEMSLISRVVDAVADGESPASLFGSLFGALAGNADMLVEVFQEVDFAMERARKKGRFDNVANLLLFKGVGLYRWGPDESTRVESAVRCWEQSLETDLSQWPWWDYPHTTATLWLCESYLDQARALKESTPQNLDPYLQKLKYLLEKVSAPNTNQIESYLASFYARDLGDRKSAQKSSQRAFESAFGLLSDSIDENDWEGYSELGHALLHYGDETNALIAYLISLPEMAKGNFARWILEFDTEAEQKLGDELVTAVERDCPGHSAGDQIDFIHKRIESHISDADDSGDNVNQEKANQEGGKITLSENLDTASNEPTAKLPVTTSVDSDDKSLIGRKQRKREMESIYKTIQRRVEEWSHIMKTTASWRYCETCEKHWSFDDALNICKYCYDVDFCDECLDKLKAGNLKITSMTVACNKNHDWLRLPKWDEAMYRRSVNKKVYVGGRIDSEGRPLGEETISVTEWLDKMKKELAIGEKPSPS